MAEIVGRITNIKVGSFLPDTVNAFDIGTITVLDNATPPCSGSSTCGTARTATRR